MNVNGALLIMESMAGRDGFSNFVGKLDVGWLQFLLSVTVTRCISIRVTTSVSRLCSGLWICV